MILFCRRTYNVLLCLSSFSSILFFTQPAFGQLLENQDGTLSDGTTQLMWSSSDTGAGTWSEALSSCQNFTIIEYHDWRLPNARELLTLVETGVMEPAADPLLNVTARSYWTSTSLHTDPSQGWTVNFQYGAETPVLKSTILPIRCVRRGSDPAAGINTSPYLVTEITAYDSRSDLTWQKWDDNTSRNLDAALSYCEDLPLDSKNDWRLPNVRELLTLAETRWFNPASHPILPMRAETYWSGTSNHSTPEQNWAVNFYYGNEESYNKASEELWVRCVRGGSGREDGNGSYRMVDNGDGIILDSETSLQWQKNVNDTPGDWLSGLSSCENLEIAGQSDWRLPNARELSTITDTRYVNPASVSVFSSRSDYYWSSTTFHTAPAQIWALHFNYGTEEPLTRDSIAYTRCVRGGPEASDTDGISLGSQLRDLEDGMVLDVFNRSLWQLEHNPDLHTWAEAMQYCKNLTLNSYNWRLPNVRELNSITSSRYHNPASESLLASDADLYWSSTTFIDAGTPEELLPPDIPYLDAWAVNFLYGNGEATDKTAAHLARCIVDSLNDDMKDLLAGLLVTPDLYIYGGTTFTGVPLGEVSQPRQIVVGNIGTGPLSIGNLTLEGTYSGLFTIVSDSCSQQSMRAAGTCFFEISYAPDSDKLRSAELHIPSDDPDNPVTIISVHGEDPSMPPEISVFPNRLDFPAVVLGESSAVQSLLIKNSGDQALLLGTLSLAGTDAALFSMSSDNCSGQTLAASAQCEIIVQFSPDIDGLKNAVVLIPDNLTAERQVPISGFGGSMSATISGRITDVNGAGLSDVNVYLYPNIGSIHTPAQAVAGPVLTDSYGFYLFSSVSSGYHVVAPEQTGNLYYPQFTDPSTSITSSFRQVELMDADFGVMGINFTTGKDVPFVKILFPRSGDKLKGDFGIFGTAFRYIGDCSGCSNVEKLEILFDGIPVLHGTLLGTRSDRFSLSQIIWRAADGMPVSTTEQYGWQDIFDVVGIVEGQWISLQVRATNENGVSNVSQTVWISPASAGAGNVVINLDAQQPFPARTSPHTLSFTADSGLTNPSWYTYQWDDLNQVEFDQRTAQSNEIPYTMDVEDIWPVAVALRDGDGNTVVDIEQILSFKPARYGNPTANGSGSHMAALGANVASGNFFHQSVDMTLEGVGSPFVFARSYNSLGVDNISWMGKGGWAHNFDRAMFLSKSGRRLFLMQPDGHADRYGFVNGRWQTMTPGGYAVITEHYGATLEEFSYTVRDKSNTQYLYKWVPRTNTGDWRLVSITDPNNNSMILSYSPTDGYLSKVTDTRGRDFIFSYYDDPALPDYGLLKTVTEAFDQEPRSVIYKYDTEGRLITFLDRRAKAWRYTYDDNSHLETIKDPSGHVLLTNVFDSDSGWIATQTDGLGHAWDISYNKDGQSGLLLDTTITDPKSNWVQYTINQDTGMVDKVTNSRSEESDSTYIDIADSSRAQDTSLVASSVNPRGNSSSYGYADTGSGNLSTIQNPVNLSMQMSYQEKRTEQNQNLLDTVTMPGITTPYNLDYYENNSKNLKKVTNPEGATVQYSYNDKGQVIKTISPLGLYTYYTWIDNYLRKVTTEFWGKQEVLITYDTLYTYDSKGRLATVTDPVGNIVEYAYNKNDQVNRKTYDLDPSLAGLDEFLYAYKANGALEETIDLNGNKITYNYNDAALLRQVNYFTGEALPIYAEVTYDELLRREDTTNFRRLTSTSSYDDMNKMTSVSNPIGETVRSRMDENGNTIWTEWRDASNNVLKTMTFTYDSADRIEKSVVIMGTSAPLVTRYAYDTQTGYLKTVTNPRGVATEYVEHDKVGRPTLIRHNSQGDSVTTRVVYDANGNAVRVTDPNGSITSYSYDPLNRLIQRDNHLGNVWSYTYDANSNLLTSTTPDQQTTVYTYGSYNRLASVSYHDGKTVTYTWDANGNITTMDDTSFKTGWQATTHEYDPLDRLTKRADAFGQNVQYTYGDTTGINTIIYPDGMTPGDRTVTYTFDDANRMESVTDWLGNITSYGYNGLGAINSIVNNHNNTSVSLEYDDAGRLTDYSNLLGSEEFAGYHYTLDANGNRTQATITQPLLPVVSIGNVAYGIPNSLNQISEMSGGTDFEYDDRGNLKTLTLDGEKRNFIYDGRDLLTYNWVTAEPDDFFIYFYSGSGDRIETRQGTTNTTDTRYTLDVNNGLSKVLMRTDASNQPLDYYIYGAAGLVSRITTDDQSYTYHYDPSGNTVALSDLSGMLVNKYAYTPYGQTTLEETVANPFQFVGQHGVMADPNGLSFMRARFYHPQLRRFLSQDKVLGNAGNSQSLNQYAYVQGNPIMRIDPSGLMFDDVNPVDEALEWSSSSISWAANQVKHQTASTVMKGAWTVESLYVASKNTFNAVDRSNRKGDSLLGQFAIGFQTFWEEAVIAECGLAGSLAAGRLARADIAGTVSYSTGEITSELCRELLKQSKKTLSYVEDGIIPVVGNMWIEGADVVADGVMYMENQLIGLRDSINEDLKRMHSSTPDGRWYTDYVEWNNEQMLNSIQDGTFGTPAINLFDIPERGYIPSIESPDLSTRQMYFTSP